MIKSKDSNVQYSCKDRQYSFHNRNGYGIMCIELSHHIGYNRKRRTLRSYAHIFCEEKHLFYYTNFQRTKS
jgi:hypothetical protein